jgi:hypothetical protein
LKSRDAFPDHLVRLKPGSRRPGVGHAEGVRRVNTSESPELGLG